LRVIWLDEVLGGSPGVAKLKQAMPHLEVRGPKWIP